MSLFLKLIKSILGKNLVKKIRPFGHGIKSYLAAFYFGFPAKKLKLIGVTGTKGKTSTTILAGRVLNLAGLRTAYISTALINLSGDHKDEFLNRYKMTTIDVFWLQKYLKEALENGCQWVVLEMSSQGLEQNRHLGLGGFDITTFLNIYPEHIEAHGSFENYKNAKSILFKNIKENGTFIYNSNDDQVEQSNFMFDQISEVKRTTIKKVGLKANSDYSILEDSKAIYKSLNFKGVEYPTKLVADFELVDLVFAIKILENIAPDFKLTYLLKDLDYNLPGRMEFVVLDGKILKGDNNEVYKNQISVLVDYAHEPESLKQLLVTLQSWKNKKLFDKLIHILSSDGAGRDDWKKPVMGDLSLKFSDSTIITTDNYEKTDNPEDVLKLLSQNFPNDGQKSFKYFLEKDRLLAFQKALDLAKMWSSDILPEKILIVSTGVGSEQGLTRPGGVMVWDERQVWIEQFKLAFDKGKVISSDISTNKIFIKELNI